MEQKLIIGKPLGKVLSERIGIVILVPVVIIIGLSTAGYVFKLEWTGLVSVLGKEPKILWHWLDLLPEFCKFA